jgi:nucleoid-associated protein YgaU
VQRPLLIIIATAVVAAGGVYAYSVLEQDGPSRVAPVRIAAAPAQNTGGRANVPVTAAVVPAVPEQQPHEASDPPASRPDEPAATNADADADAGGETELANTEPAAEPVAAAEPQVAEAAPEPTPEAEPQVAEPEPEVATEPVAVAAETEPAPDEIEAVAEAADAELELAGDSAVDPAEPEADATAAAETVVAAVDEPGIADGLSPPGSADIPAPPAIATEIAAAPPAPPAALREPAAVAAADSASEPAAPAAASSDTAALSPPAPPPAPLTEPDAVTAVDSAGEPAASAVAISESAALSTLSPPPAAPTAEPGAASPLPPAEVRPRAVEAAPDMTAPSFDIVHISADGHSVFAGRAEPGAAISIMDGDEIVGSALADARGEWVVIPDAPLPAGSRELGIAARGEAGTEALSESVVVLHVPESPGNAEVAPSAIDHDPIAVSLPRGDTGIARLMQSGEPGYGIEGAQGLSLDSISYDAVGSFSISGRAQPDNEIAAYLDEHGIGRTRASRVGDWTIMPEESINPGFYTLRVDQLDDGGSVVSQIQTPFNMADIGETDMADGLVVVQPGNSLWRIARRVYGHGTQHTIIFQANRDQIREASLIYPGQIFMLPAPPDGE